MITSSRIYQMKDGLVCDIPSSLYPTATERTIEEKITLPGYRYTSPTWFYATVNPFADRIALILSHAPYVISPASAILGYGLDPTKPIQIRPYGTSSWINAHPYHDAYGRAWLPKLYGVITKDVRRQLEQRPGESFYAWEKRLREWRREQREFWQRTTGNILQYTQYPVQIRGTTPPTQQIRRRTIRVREIQLRYIEDDFNAVQYEEDRYRWEIPKVLREVNDVLNMAIANGLIPTIEFYAYNDIIYVNFMFKGFERRLFEIIGRCYRYTSDLKISLKDEREYKFNFDIRSHYLSILRQTYYVDPKGKPITINEALAWTNKNLFDGHSQLGNIRAGFQTGKDLLRRDPHTGQTIKISRSVAPLQVEGMIEEPEQRGYVGYEAEKIDIGEAFDERGQLYKMYYCLKRVDYHDPGFPTVNNEGVEARVRGERKIWLDQNGFIWWRYASML